MSSSRYAREVDLADLNSSHTQAVLLTPDDSSVLDIGVADGSVARALVARGCQVWGVEIDADAAAEAKSICKDVVVGDVESLDLDEAFGARRFDVVLLLDVLEHLVDPAATLRRAAATLAPGGHVVVSLPNVTHAAVRLDLLRGSFTYTEAGLLDRTHLRFFDAVGVTKLFADAGLDVVESLRVTAPVDATEIELDLASFAPEVLREATSGPEALTYQFVVTAVPSGTSPRADQGGTLTGLLQNQVRELSARLAEASDYSRSLEAQDQQKSAYIAELGDRVHALEASLRERVAQVALLMEQNQALSASVEVKDAYIADLRGDPRRKAQIESHAGYAVADRAYAALQRRPLLLRTARWVARRAANRPAAE
ncbi:MAG TPA: methyltransferase domain-containing protein [Mycobacteriales bacterium]|nr:methyltransferase domain-containing protein [Mycobacteriales bacterium]